MNREEAIRIIETVFQDETVYKYYDSITHQALDMAIEALKQVTGKLNNPDDSLLTAAPEACKEQKSKLDLISRQAAIDALKEERCPCESDYDEGYLSMLDKAIWIIQEWLPSAQPEWIPCREKAAELNCLACDEFGQVFIASSIVTINGVCYDGTGFNFDVKEFLKGEKMQTLSGYIYVPPRKITAWMPLPEPYKEDNNG